MTLPFNLDFEVLPYQSAMELIQGAAIETDVLWLAICARVETYRIRREIARRWDALPTASRTSIVDTLREDILAGQWPPAKVDIAADADPAGSEWTQ